MDNDDAGLGDALGQVPRNRCALNIEGDRHRIGIDVANSEAFFDVLDVGARAMQAAGVDDLRRVWSAIVERAVVALLPFGELRLGEGVVPAEIVPDAHGVCKGNDVRALSQKHDVLVGRRAVAAALAGEEFHHHGARGVLGHVHAAALGQGGRSDEQREQCAEEAGCRLHSVPLSRSRTKRRIKTLLQTP